MADSSSPCPPRPIRPPYWPPCSRRLEARIAAAFPASPFVRVLEPLVDLAVFQREDPHEVSGPIRPIGEAHHVDPVVHHDRALGEGLADLHLDPREWT